MVHLDSKIHVFSLSTLFHSGKRGIKGNSAKQLQVNCLGIAANNSTS